MEQLSVSSMGGALPQGGRMRAHRPVVRSRKGMVATAHYAASMAGIRMLLLGGNAADAAIAGAVALGVVEPYMSGLGGAGFLIISRGHGLERQVLNFSGQVPEAGFPDAFSTETHTLGAKASLVPGNPAGWLTLLSEHGSLPVSTVLEPAIELAEDGYSVSDLDSRFFEANEYRLKLFSESRDVFMPRGRSLRGGDILKQPNLSRTLQYLADNGIDGFYRGEIANEIERFMVQANGLINISDLKSYKPRWESPIGITYNGYEIIVPGPNSNAFQILETLNILEGFEIRSMEHNSAEYIHLVAEAIKLAATDRIVYGGDPDFMDVPADSLISKEYAQVRRSHLSQDRASVVMGERYDRNASNNSLRAGDVNSYSSGETTHLAAADGQGTIVTITQTHGAAFGSALVAGNTGVLLNNLISLMDIEGDSEVRLLVHPGKRPGSNMAPVQVFKEGKFILSIGTPGAYGIPQTTTQMLLNIIEFGMNVQEAVEAPRFRVLDGVTISMEDRISCDTKKILVGRGHDIKSLGDWAQEVGGGHAIASDSDTGVMAGAADPRREGYALGM